MSHRDFSKKNVQENTAPKIIPVILSGGAGSRLWPISSPDIPKQFLNFMGERSLLQTTALRALDITGAPDSHLVTITLSNLKQRTLQHLSALGPDMADHVLCEPEARNTAAALTFTALYVRKHFGSDALMLVMPSDHYISPELALTDYIHKAATCAQEGLLVTFGIKPTGPNTGYGYIEKGKKLHQDGGYAVSNFTEKPHLELAQTYCESEDYLWNSGIHLFQAQTVLKELKRYAPETLKIVRQALTQGTHDKSPAKEPYLTIKKEPFERAVLERSDKIAVIPCILDWRDLGSWESLWEAAPKDENGNVANGPVLLNKTSNTLIHITGKRLVACAGVEDLIIAETDNALLIAKKGDDAAIREIVKKIRTLPSRKTAKIKQSSQIQKNT